MTPANFDRLYLNLDDVFLNVKSTIGEDIAAHLSNPHELNDYTDDKSSTVLPSSTRSPTEMTMGASSSQLWEQSSYRRTRPGPSYYEKLVLEFSQWAGGKQVPRRNDRCEPL